MTTGAPASAPIASAEAEQATGAIGAGYRARTPGSRRVHERSLEGLTWARSTPGLRLGRQDLAHPIVLTAGEAGHVRDVDGNDYVDLALGGGSHVFGHAQPAIRTAIAGQVERGVCIGPNSDLAGEVAERLHALTGHERSAFLTTGSEAMMVALRLARCVTQKSRIAVFDGAHHGHYDGLLARRGEGAATVPSSPGVAETAVKETLILPLDVAGLSRALEAARGTLATVVIDAAHLAFAAPSELHELVRRVRDYTKGEGIPLLLDERATSLWLGPRGAAGVLGIEPEISVYGRTLAAGMPLAMIAGRARYLDAVDGGTWSFGDDSVPTKDKTFLAGTFNKHPVATAAALATLDHVAGAGREALGALAERAEAFASRLREITGGIFSVRHLGPLFHLSGSPELVDWLSLHLATRGVHAPELDAFYISPAHTDRDLAEVLAAFASGIDLLRVRATSPRPTATRVAAASAKRLVRRANPSAPMRLFCFHHAGGNIGTFAGWDTALAEHAELFLVELPGRVAGDAIPTSFSALVAELAEAIRGQIDRPFAFFGHSMGALLSFEIARSLRRAAGLVPRLLAVSGDPAPQFPDPNASQTLDGLDAKGIHDLLLGYGVPAAILEDASIMREFVPTLRVDLGLRASYVYAHEAPLDCPIAAFAGSSDHLATREQMAGWMAHTTREFSLRVLPGDHFFVRSAREDLLRFMSRDLGVAKMG